MSVRTCFKKETMKTHKPLNRCELNIVYMKYFEGLNDVAVAKRLGLRLNRVKDRLKSPHVEDYICDVVLPYKRKQRISKIKVVFVDSIKTVEFLALSGIIVLSVLAIVTITFFLVNT